MEWVVIGDLANVVQLSLSLKLIYAIVAAAKNARMHKRNCRQFAQHLKMIANLLEQLKPQDVDEFPEFRETREPLDHLEQCLKKGLTLVENCRDKSYLYLIAMGWSIVGQFKECQNEIDKYLRLIPLVSLVENHREKLRAIVRDRREYTLDEEAKKIIPTLLKDDRTRDDAVVLQKSLSRHYPGLGLDRALREENEKLRKELHRKQLQMDLDQCDVIEHLLEITKFVNLSKEEQEMMKNLPTHSRASTMDSIDLSLGMPIVPPDVKNAAPQPKVINSSPPSADGPTQSSVPTQIPEAPRPPPHSPRMPPRSPRLPPQSPRLAPHPPHVPTYPSHLPTNPPQVPSYPSHLPTHPPHVPGYPPHVPAYPPHVPGYPHVPTYPSHMPAYPPHVPGYPPYLPAHMPQMPIHPPHFPTHSPHFSSHPSPLPTQPHSPHILTGNNRSSRRDDDESDNYQTWHNGLFECWMDPFLCVSTFLYPCGTFTNIAAVITDGKITQELACHDLAFHSLYLGCCLFTCCFRRKVRKRFSITGGTCDDCWAHICCCCCALVQEWREIQAHEEEGLKLYRMRVPSQQTMENYRPRPNPNNQERYNG